MGLEVRMNKHGNDVTENRTDKRTGVEASRVAVATAQGDDGGQAVDIFTDGACSGNPGPGGWGAILRSGMHEKEIWGGEPATTNNRMELIAVIRALEMLKRPVSIRVHTDSQYVQKGISEWIHGWKRRGWKTASNAPVKNVDLWQALDKAVSAHRIEWIWVKGHAGHAENERADALARQGVEAVRRQGRAVDVQQQEAGR